MFNKRRQHSIIVTRGIGTMETVQFTMTTDKSSNFEELLLNAEAAISKREEEYYRTEKAAGEANRAAAEAEAKKGKK